MIELKYTDFDGNEKTLKVEKISTWTVLKGMQRLKNQANMSVGEYIETEIEFMAETLGVDKQEFAESLPFDQFKIVDNAFWNQLMGDDADGSPEALAAKN
ncbi:hypothetical protein GTO87_03005 [Ligilactobacillus saerimneri]|uniref:Phage tail assembly protein n=1 Tax=Ligilactobacillus saerimneri TaxID=228229 RepID=A0A7H9EK44_9LACO|nr:hypothetical protein [Ligilactobacillus saerimneri]QLL77657.1 hypothetical protein GTO87_03005 [Ligilactobacillus saerimneri]